MIFLRAGPHLATLKVCHLMQLVLLFSFSSMPMDAIAQEPRAREFQLYRNAGGQVDAVHYFGRLGLRAAQVDRLPQLAQVSILYGTTLTSDDIAYLSTLTSISELRIGQETIDPSVSFEGDLSALASLTALEYVHLCKHDISDEDLKFVAALPKLTRLRFNSDSEVSDGYFSVSDRCADFLSKATMLESVVIQGSGKLTDEFVAKLTAGASGLQHLDMSSVELTDESLRLLAVNCKQLKWLDLYSKRFTDKGLEYLADAKTLEILWLRSGSLTSDCVQFVGGLKSLRHLELSVPTVSDEGIQLLANLPSLEILALRQPQLTDKQFAMFRNHPTLASAFVNGATLTEGEVLKTIAKIATLKHLDVGRANPLLQTAVNRELLKRKPVR